MGMQVGETSASLNSFNFHSIFLVFVILIITFAVI